MRGNNSHRIIKAANMQTGKKLGRNVGKECGDKNVRKGV